MPAYDFRCIACAHVFELTRGLTDTSDVSCPECGGATKRVFTPVGVVFKGSGFHNTDYRPPRPEESSTKTKEPCPSAGASGACASCPAAD